ncbi:hypothetical protein [Metabacillus iocasae]|uniref:Uncharacterized protein n=1 Tax=Priestia iocasae TaxID=2291674 RepID=A0ABS2QUS2_9BACI|nr:hypothetical protein [Metabacillus iocasae]MBM7703243.1 hypothetical protein [Metabacillus iocasae]
MYRSQVNGQEIILLFSLKETSTVRTSEEKESVYKRILQLGDKLLSFNDGTSFTIGDPLGLIVAQVKKSDLTTIYIEHIIDKQFMYHEDQPNNQIII